MAPKKGYFELEAHPPIIYTVNASSETANKYRIPTLISDNTSSSLIGITAQATRASVIVIIGARIKITLLALAISDFFKNIF